MVWLYEQKQIEKLPGDCIGFVYLITNKQSGRKYIGKKLAKFSKTSYKVVKLKNGNKKRKKIKSKIDSDWQDYFGSSDELKKDVETLGIDKFTREVLYYCKSKAECSYIEAREQLEQIENDLSYLKTYYEVFQNAHIFYRGQARDNTFA